MEESIKMKSDDLNRTIVECKFKADIKWTKADADLNRTIVECK